MELKRDKGSKFAFSVCGGKCIPHVLGPLFSQFDVALVIRISLLLSLSNDFA